MLDIFSQMLWPLLACFILVGIHAYLGIHVVARKVIFVDLALAQIAALGAVYGVFLGLSFDQDVLVIKIASVIFTLLGAMLISFTRTNNEHIPHEAIIGIIYATALSLTVLMTANLPHGADEVQQMLAGSILWVSPKEVIYTGLLYAGIGLIHWIFRRQFFALSHDLANKNFSMSHLRLWDFLFYATFGVVVTSSVGMGGVLLVFGFLVIPSVMGVMLAKSTRARLLIGWLSGSLVSVAGVVFSYFLDLPSGPVIVVFLGLLLGITALIKEILHPKSRKLGVFHGALFSSLALFFCFLPYFWRYQAGHEEHISLQHRLLHEQNDEARLPLIEAMLSSGQTDEIISALAQVEKFDLPMVLPRVLNFLEHSDAIVREKVVNLVALMGYEKGVPHIKKAFFKEGDDFLKIAMAEALLQLKDAEGILFLAKLALHPASFISDDAKEHLARWLGDEQLGREKLTKISKWALENIFYDDEKKVYQFK